MHIPSLIERKCEGGELSSEEIHVLIAAFRGGEMPDYQMSALVLAMNLSSLRSSCLCGSL